MIARDFLCYLFAQLASHTSEEQDKAPARTWGEAAEIHLCLGKSMV